MKNFNKPMLRSTAVVACTAGVISLTTASCGSSSPDKCRAISRIYPGDHSPGVTSDRRTWRSGIAVLTPRFPKGVIGLIIGFKSNPEDINSSWVDSDPVSKRAAHNITLIIGNGAVQFSTQFESPSGLPICNPQPQTSFGIMQPLNHLYKGTEPYWSPQPEKSVLPVI